MIEKWKNAKRRFIIKVLGCVVTRRAGKGKTLGSLAVLIKAKGFLDHEEKQRHGCVL